MKLNHTNAGLRICINEVDRGRLGGQVYSQRLKEPMAFGDIAGLLLQVEDLLDQQDFPRAFQRKRIFHPKKQPKQEASGDRHNPGELPEEEGQPYMTAEQVQAAAGKMATFVLYIVTRQNTTWQGKVDWLDGTEDQFSSALELIYMVDQKVLY